MYELPQRYCKGWIKLEAESGMTLDFTDHVSHQSWCKALYYFTFLGDVKDTVSDCKQ